MSINNLLSIVDEVHTMTSLTTFEAIVWGNKVTCYGLPFYAGWGLTYDKISRKRRGGKLPIDELVAAALILYRPMLALKPTGFPQFLGLVDIK